LCGKISIIHPSTVIDPHVKAWRLLDRRVGRLGAHLGKLQRGNLADASRAASDDYGLAFHELPLPLRLTFGFVEVLSLFDRTPDAPRHDQHFEMLD